MDSGVAVLHLVEIQPSELKPLDQVKADIQKHLIELNAQEYARTTAQLQAGGLKAAVAKGTDFKQAAEAMKLNVVTLPAFVPNSVQNGDPKMQSIAYASISLQPNQVSGPFQIQGTNLFAVAHLDSRAQPDPAGLTDFEKTVPLRGRPATPHLRHGRLDQLEKQAIRHPQTARPRRLRHGGVGAS